MMIPSSEADTLLQKMLRQAWTVESPDSASIHYGKSYTMYGGPCAGEIPTFPDFLMDIKARVERRTQMLVNYIQAHRFDPSHPVHPHRDPRAMIVPMLVMGQGRTFRAGGELPRWAYQFPHKRRKLEWHVGGKEILLDHGSILTFNGGKIVHSMLPADYDKNFRTNGCDTRVTLLFRYTTPAMRLNGCNKNAESVREYAAVQHAYRNGGYAAIQEYWQRKAAQASEGAV